MSAKFSGRQHDFCEHFSIEEAEHFQPYDVFEEDPRPREIPPFLDIVWADDLAIVVTHPSATTMLERLRFAISRTFHHSLRHALIPNLKKGKTEAMLFLRGPGSKTVRAQYFNVDEPFLEIDDTVDSLRKVLVSSGYRHLGSKIHLGKGFLPEIKARLGMASSIFRKHRRLIFQNRLLTLERRRYLFTTMVLSIVRYNTGTWGILSKAEEKYFVSRLMAMYRSLLRAEIPDTTLRYWNNNMVLKAVGLAEPLQLLHEARLSFVVSMFRSGPPSLWGLAAIEKSWLSSIRQAKCWMHEQIKGCGPDRFGNLWSPNYAQEAQERPDSFKRWIRRAAHHSRLQRQLHTHWIEWHHDFLLSLIQGGYQIHFPWPSGSNIGMNSSGEACLQCHKVFVNRAAWSVHAFKIHNRVNDKRSLVHHTRCEVCMREFGTRDKLQRHLNYKTSCAIQLRQAGHLFPIQPGINSRQLRTPLEYPVPVMPTAGPQREWQQPAAVAWNNGIDSDFLESLVDCAETITETTAFGDIVQCFKDIFTRSAASFEELKTTFNFFKVETLKHWEDMRGDNTLNAAMLADALQWVEDHLHLRWFFTEEECTQLPCAEDLRTAAWDHCRGRKASEDVKGWLPVTGIPQLRSRQLVFVHFFAGEKRDGDLQDALNNMSIPEGCIRTILAVDIIYDSVRADLSRDCIQQRWLGFIRRGFITAFYAGPPCESWTRSRQLGGIPNCSVGDGGPRILRVAERPQGLPSLRLREVEQLLLANGLLLFVLRAFLEMILMHRFAMIEHPAEPQDESERWIASIWRLYVVECLQRHPWVQQVTIAQGYFGAKSPKPTTLLYGCGNKFSAELLLRQCQTVSTLPKALEMGRCGTEFATASLKNYPKDLCVAMSVVLQKWLQCYVSHTIADLPLTTDDQQGFDSFVQNLLVHFNFAAQRGADFAR